MAVPAVSPGDQVYFMTGRYLGKVSAVAEGRFRVDGDDGNLWLVSRAVFTVEHRRVTLVCEREGLASYLAEAD